jgi:glucose/arabinose dehydrogenase
LTSNLKGIHKRSNLEYFLLIGIVIATALALTISCADFAYAAIAAVGAGAPTVKDHHLKVQVYTQGLISPTSMAFLDNNHILVLQQTDGTVHLISNGLLQQEPVLKVSVNNKNERGLLGIAVLKNNTAVRTNNHTVNAANTSGPATQNTSSKASVFLYYTETSNTGKLLGNRVYKYEWNGQALVNPSLILDLPAKPGTNHQGGKMIIGPDRFLYVVIGELQRNGQLQNIKDGPPPDDSGVIFRVNPDNGSPAPNNPFTAKNASSNSDSNDAAAVESKLSKYYAYGIRNSFGIKFDPLSQKLWDTENGEKTYDEINLVNPGFNSGWKKIMGPMARNSSATTQQLVNFPGSHYSDPVFSWLKSIGITDLEFLNSSKLGDQYSNNIFVGDVTSGNLYYFTVNKSRTGLNFDPNTQHGLSDLVADNANEVLAVTFGTGFGGITDIKTSPDGYLYILSYGNGIIYRVVPSS